MQADGPKVLTLPNSAEISRLVDAAAVSRTPTVLVDRLSRDHPVVHANDAFLALTGYRPDEVLGRTYPLVEGSNDGPNVSERIHQSLNRGDHLTVDIQTDRKNGLPIWTTLNLSPLSDPDGVVRFVSAEVSDITPTIEREKTLRTLLDEAEKRAEKLERALDIQQIMIREVDHRAKNNLQMVSAMLTLQAISIPDLRVRTTLEEMLARVEALGLVHKRLYELSQLIRFDLADLTRELVDTILGAAGRRDIALEIELQPVTIDADSAAAVALIMNEGLTNAVKHGFRDGRTGLLSVRLLSAGGRCTVDIADDGHGLPPEPDRMRSFGTTLIETLANQVQAVVELTPRNPGTLFRLSFPLGPQS